MTLDNMTGITKGSYTGVDMFCKSQLITCNRVKECNGVCPFEDALKHADKEQSLNEQNNDHDRDWIIGCIEHDGFIHTHRFDKANQIIHDALLADAEWIPCNKQMPDELAAVNITWVNHNPPPYYKYTKDVPLVDSAVYYRGKWYWWDATVIDLLGEYDGAYIHGIEPIDKDIEVTAWMPLPEPYRKESEVGE